MAKLREEFDEKLKAASKQEETLSLAWKEREQALESLIENLKLDVENAKENYKNLINGLDSGDNEYLM